MDRQRRHALRVPIILSAQQDGTTVDLGERGLGFMTSRCYQPGEQLQIRVMLTAAQPLNISAQIVWCRQTSADPGQAYRCGARLSSIGLRESFFLKNYLAGVDHPAA